MYMSGDDRTRAVVQLRRATGGGSLANELMRGAIDGYQLQRRIDGLGVALDQAMIDAVRRFIEQDEAGARRWFDDAEKEVVDDALVLLTREPLPLSAGILPERVVRLVMTGDAVTYVPEAIVHMVALRELVIVAAPVTHLPGTLGRLERLETLVIERTEMRLLMTDDAYTIHSLQELVLRDNVLLERLPVEFSLSQVRRLEIVGSPLLEHVPATIGGAFRLQRFIMARTAVRSLPANFNMVDSLESLVLESLPLLETLPAPSLFGASRPLEWTRLRQLTLDSLPRLGSIDATLVGAPNLQRLAMRYLTHVQMRVTRDDSLQLLDLTASDVPLLPPEITRLTLRSSFQLVARSSTLEATKSESTADRAYVAWMAYVERVLEPALMRYGSTKDEDGDYVLIISEVDVLERLTEEYERYTAINRIDAFYGVDAEEEVFALAEQIVDAFDEPDLTEEATEEERARDDRREELMAVFTDPELGLPRVEWVALNYPHLADAYRVAMERLELDLNVTAVFRAKSGRTLTSERMVERYIRGAYELIDLEGRGMEGNVAFREEQQKHVQKVRRRADAMVRRRKVKR